MVMIVFNVFPKANTVSVEIYGILITLIRVVYFATLEKASDGRYVEESLCHHPTGELECVGGTFLEVQSRVKHILEIRGTRPQKLN